MTADAAVPELTFGATDLTSCIQSISLTVNGQDITYWCGGEQKVIAGGDDVNLTVSLAVLKTDTVRLAAVQRGTVAVSEYHPAGDTATYSEYSTTVSTVTSYTDTANPGSYLAIDLTFHWDDLTYGAAA